MTAGLVVAAGGLGVGAWGAGAAGAAAAGPTPADVILSTSLPGFVASPPGSFNGPVSTSTLLTYTHNPDLLTEIENGTISGYLRYWGRSYGRFNGIVSDLVVQFPNPAQTTAFLDGLEQSLTAQLNVTTFIPTTPSGAMGYAGHNAVVSGSTDYAVSFGRGDFAAFVLAATPVGGVSSAQIQLFAYAQWSALPSKASVSVPTTQPLLVPSTLPGVGGAPGGLPQISTGVPVSVSAGALSSSGVGGLEALAVIVVVVVGLFLLVAYAVDTAGRRRREGLGGAGGGGDDGGGGASGGDGGEGGEAAPSVTLSG